jgi:hypothetical protein
MRQTVLVMLTLGAAGCAVDAGSEPASSTAERLQADSYRYGGEILQARMMIRAEGPVLLEGADNARIAELLALPAAGVIVDPGHERVFWIYTNDLERDQAVNELQASLAAKPVTTLEPGMDEALPASADPSIGRATRALGAGCFTPGLSLFAANNLGGGSVFVTGAESNLPRFNFNDVTSSLTFVSGFATLFEHLDFAGHSITFVPNLNVRLSTCDTTQTFGQINALSSYTMSSTLYFFRTSWNDQTTSALFSQTQF